MAEAPGKVLLLCTANTCRSPMAAALLRHALAAQPEPLRSIEVESAGVSALDGYGPSQNAIQAMKKVGLALDGHRSRQLEQHMLDRALVVYCMTEAHRALVELQYDTSRTSVHLMRELMETQERDIPDPFGSNLQAYESCRDSMVEAIPSLLAHLRSRLEGRGT